MGYASDGGYHGDDVGYAYRNHGYGYYGYGYGAYGYGSYRYGSYGAYPVA